REKGRCIAMRSVEKTFAGGRVFAASGGPIVRCDGKRLVICVRRDSAEAAAGCRGRKGLSSYTMGRFRGRAARRRRRVSVRRGLRNLAGAVIGGAGLIAFAAGASALEVTQPKPWQISLQPAGSPIMEMIHRFNNGVLIVVTL